MTTWPVAAAHRSFRGAQRAPLVWALISAAALVLAAVWPIGSDGTSPLWALSVLSGPEVPSVRSVHPMSSVSSVNSTATADAPGIAAPQFAALPGSRDASLPVAADVLAGRADDNQEQPPTF